jgi:hypothetical protein
MEINYSASGPTEDDENSRNPEQGIQWTEEQISKRKSCCIYSSNRERVFNIFDSRRTAGTFLHLQNIYMYNYNKKHL